MKLSQLVRAQESNEELVGILRWQVAKLIELDEPCWKLAGKLAVNLQRRGYPNAAKRVQLAVSDENQKALADVLRDLRSDRGIFPSGS
jgi:hypothetical protein